VITTQFKPDDFDKVLERDFDDQGKCLHPYYCPLCMTFSNRTLAFQCCANYICFDCADAMVQLSLKLKQSRKCPLGCNFDKPEDFPLEIRDVDCSLPIIKYTDS